jgi:uncharacterized alpha-E superfamily protein
MHCAAEIYKILKSIETTTSHEAVRRAGDISARLEFARIDDIIDEGLHEYLIDFLDRIGELGTQIHQGFFSPQQWEARLA